MRPALAAPLAAAALIVLAVAAPAAARAQGPWDPLATSGTQRVTIHILPSVHGRENVQEPNVAIIPGEAVTVTIVNTSREFHTFTVPRLHVNVVVRPGSPSHPRSTAVTFTAPSVGTFRWYCEFCPAVHHEGSMRGTVYALVAG